jgi:hypothetical protein
VGQSRELDVKGIRTELLWMTKLAIALVVLALASGCRIDGNTASTPALSRSTVAPPASPMVTETNSTDVLMLAWNPVTNVPVSYYTLGRRTNSANSFSNVVNTVATNVSIVFPTVGTEYAVTATGTNGLTSIWSDSVTYNPPPPPPPVTNIWVWTARLSTNFPSTRAQLVTEGQPFTNWPTLVFTNIDSVSTNFPKPKEWLWVVATNRTLK